MHVRVPKPKPGWEQQPAAAADPTAPRWVALRMLRTATQQGLVGQAERCWTLHGSRCERHPSVGSCSKVLVQQVQQTIAVPSECSK